MLNSLTIKGDGESMRDSLGLKILKVFISTQIHKIKSKNFNLLLK